MWTNEILLAAIKEYKVNVAADSSKSGFLAKLYMLEYA